MPKPFIGVRWWLGVAFAVVAATSTAIVVSQFSDRSEKAFRSHGETVALHDAQAAARKNVTPATLDRVASKLQGNVRLQLFGAGRSAARRLGARARGRELGGSRGGNFVKGTSDGGTFVAAIPYHGQVLVAISRQPADGRGDRHGQRRGAARGRHRRRDRRHRRAPVRPAHRPAPAPADAPRPRRSRRATSRRRSATASATSSACSRTASTGCAASCAARFRRLEAERDRLRLLLERLHEGVLTIDQDLVVHFANTEARRILGGRLREGDELPEPWQSVRAPRLRAGTVRRAGVRHAGARDAGRAARLRRSSASRPSPRPTGRCSSSTT